MPTTTRRQVARYQRDRLQRVAVTHPVTFVTASAVKALVIDVPRRIWRRAR